MLSLNKDSLVFSLFLSYKGQLSAPKVQ